MVIHNDLSWWLRGKKAVLNLAGPLYTNFESRSQLRACHDSVPGASMNLAQYFEWNIVSHCLNYAILIYFIANQTNLRTLKVNG
jgi:hypothetical protein